MIEEASLKEEVAALGGIEEAEALEATIEEVATLEVIEVVKAGTIVEDQEPGHEVGLEMEDAVDLERIEQNVASKEEQNVASKEVTKITDSQDSKRRSFEC